MKPELTYPKRPSSNKKPENKAGLSDPAKPMWQSSEDDENPSIIVVIDRDEKVYVEEVVITKQTNVRMVTVTPLSVDEKPVRIMVMMHDDDDDDDDDDDLHHYIFIVINYFAKHQFCCYISTFDFSVCCPLSSDWFTRTPGPRH